MKLKTFIIEKSLMAYCYFIGIRKGKRIINYIPGYYDRADDGLVFWSEVKGFDFVWITNKKFGFSIHLHNYIHDREMSLSLGNNDIFIQRDSYSSGFYKIKQIKNILKAQDFLKSQFTMLKKPF